MSDQFKDIVKRFSQIDKNHDFEIDAEEYLDEFGHDIKLSDLDNNHDNKISLDEYLNAKNVYYDKIVKTQVILKNNILSKSAGIFKENGITDIYNSYIILLGLRSPENLEESLGKVFEVARELSVFGLNPDDVAGIINGFVARGDGELLIADMVSTGIFDRESAIKYLSDILKKKPFIIKSLLECAKKAIDGLKKVGISDKDTIIQLLDFEDVIRNMSKIESVLETGILKENDIFKIVHYRIDNDSTTNLYAYQILDSKIHLAIDALRTNGVNDEEIREIILQIVDFRCNRIIIDSLPEVFDVLKKFQINPISFLKETLPLADKNNLFSSFETFQSKANWLSGLGLTEDVLFQTIKKSFIAGISFNTFNTVHKKLKKKFNEFNEVSLLEYARSISKSDFGSDVLCNNIDFVKRLDMTDEEKMDLLHIMSALTFSHYDIDELFCGLRKVEFSDIEICDILYVFRFQRENVLQILQLNKINQNFKLYQNKADMEQIIHALINDSVNSNKVLSMLSSFSDEKVKFIVNDLLWQKAVDTFGFQYLIYFLAFANNSGYFDKKADLSELISDCLYLRNNNINYFGRYSHKIVDKIKNQDVDKKNAFVLFPVTDYNGAFYQDLDGLEKIVDADYNMNLHEAGHERNFYDKLSEFKDDYFDLLMLNGHGKPTDLSLSNGNGEEFFNIDITDKDDFIKYVFPKMKDGSRIILYSCSTGQDLAKKIASWALEYGKRIEVIAPPVPVAGGIFIDQEGKVDISFKENSEVVPSVRLNFVF